METEAAPITLLFANLTKIKLHAVITCGAIFFHMVSTRTCREFSQVLDTSTSPESDTVTAWEAHPNI